MKNKIERYIKNIRDTILAANQNHDIWWVYKHKDTRSKFLDIMNHYPAFFQTSLHAHFAAMVIQLYRLFETRQDTISFPQLIRLLDGNSKLSDNAKRELDSFMAKAKPIWIKIGIIRSEIFAHANNEATIEESFKKADIRYDQFRELIDLSKTISNVITQDFDRSTHTFDLSAGSDTVELLTDLMKAL